MKLTDKQIECQKLGAGNFTGFGYIIGYKKEDRTYGIQISKEYREEDGSITVFVSDFPEDIDCKKTEVTGFGKPIDWGRLCYLYRAKGTNQEVTLRFIAMERYANECRGLKETDTNRKVYNQNILERPPVFVDKVYDFLKSLAM